MHYRIIGLRKFSEFPFSWSIANLASCCLQTVLATIILFSKMSDLQPIKSKWFNQKKKKKTLFTAFPLISFQDSRHNICHRDFNPSEGCSLLTFRGMEGLKKEERESSKHPPIRNAQHLVWGNGISRQWCQNSDAASADDTYFHGWIPHAFENLLQFWLPAQWFLQFVSYHKGVLFLFWHNTNYIARDGHTTVNSTDNSGFP